MNRSTRPIVALALTLGVSLLPALAHARQATPAAARAYAVTVLEPLGGDSSAAFGLNALGQAVGGSNTANGQETPGPGTRAVLWTDGTATDLGTLGGDFSAATDLNDAAQVVGESTTPSGETHAFLWEAGAMTDLGTLGGSHSEAIRINNAGQIVGLSTTAPGQEAGDPGTHAFLWEDGVMTDLGTLGGEFSRANGISDAGQVIGGAETADGETHFFRWENGTMSDLGTLPGFTVSRAIRNNAAGQLVGFATEPVGTPTAGAIVERRAVLWADGVMTDLGTLGGPNSFAGGVDASGRVVGWAELAVDGAGLADASPAATGEEVAPPRHAFIWENGVMTDLNDLIPADSGVVVHTGFAINESCQIAGTGTVDGEARGLILTPVA